jgi:TonB family protein
MLIALLCLLELPPTKAQSTEAPQGLTVLDSQKASRLLLTRVLPEYPALAKLNYIQGRVRVQLFISPAGEVLSAHVLIGNPLLAAAVLRAVSEWRYRPLAAAGSSTSFVTVCEVNFLLHFRKWESPPPEAESDFSRQVKPPEVLTRPDPPAFTHPSVHMRLLVNADGKVIDARILKGSSAGFEEAKKSLEQWSFRPARWGAISVPWYLEVEVPVNNVPAPTRPRSPSGS